MRRLWPWVEVALAQLLVLAASGPLAGVFAGITTLLLLPLLPPDTGGFGPAAVFVLAFVPGYVLAFALLWLLAWRYWFRARLPPGRFLIAWLISLPLVLLAWATWQILRGYYA